jgi:thioredoxin-like negative regulator of GroEL
LPPEPIVTREGSNGAGLKEDERPRLLFFYSDHSGACRRAEGFLAQVLQHRQNHDTFRLYRIEGQSRPDLTDRFRVNTLPTLLVAENGTINGRLEHPRGAKQIARFLEPWLR